MDQDLVKEVKGIIDAGASAGSKESLGKVFEFIKAVSTENEDLKEELEDMDIKVQMVVTDADIKYWLKAAEGMIDFGEGEIESPSFTFSATLEVASGMMIGEVDATSAYMAGDITVEGNLQDAMAFQEILELAMEAFEDYAEDL
jgi:putative sterol carrier protein